MSIVSSKPVGPPNKSAALSQHESEDPGQVPINPGFEVESTCQGQVDLQTDAPTFATYLDSHRDWMERCFKPLKVLPLTDDSYKVQFFRIAGLGLEVEPCFGIQLWSEDRSLFRLRSIELPMEAETPYQITCLSSFRLEPLEPASPLSGYSAGGFVRETSRGSSPPMIRVHWHLNLLVGMELPGLVKSLPSAFVHRVASRIVNQVTRSMSERLTRNVCSDFYQTIGQQGQPYRLVNTRS